MLDLRGKTAVVTGGASGIGLALVRCFAIHGMQVVVADIELEKAQAVAAELGEQALAVACDVTKPESVDALAEAAYQRFGSVEVICNNAGVFPTLLPTWEQPIADWHWLMNVNLFGIIHGIRSFVPRMLQTGASGFVVNTVSLAGFITAPYVGPYYASKHAAMAVSECLEFELRALDAPIQVVTINPGWVNTKLMESRRNHPEQVEAPAQGAREAARAAKVEEMVANAITPDQVAAAVWKAMETGQFYLFPEPERKRDAEVRFGEILGEKNPKWPRT